MKNLLLCTTVILISLLLLPLWILAAPNKTTKPPQSITASSPKNNVTKYDSFKVLEVKSKKIITLSALEYVTGVVAAEMPALYEEQALKAQAVAAYTFACYKRQSSTEEYHLTTDSTTHQAYLSKEELKEKWGDNFQEYYEKISKIVTETAGQILTYKDKAALTVYHAVSPGKTNPSKDVWGKELPYLTSVESIGDRLSKDYISVLAFTKSQVEEALGTSGEGFVNPVATKTGLVTKIEYGGKEFTGADIQKRLNLRSAAFTVENTADGFSFTVYGYGHGVGMSQNGAQYMAKQGSSYQEILSYYYTGCSLKQL